MVTGFDGGQNRKDNFHPLPYWFLRRTSFKKWKNRNSCCKTGQDLNLVPSSYCYHHHLPPTHTAQASWEVNCCPFTTQQDRHTQEVTAQQLRSCEFHPYLTCHRLRLQPCIQTLLLTSLVLRMGISDLPYSTETFNRYITVKETGYATENTGCTHTTLITEREI